MTVTDPNSEIAINNASMSLIGSNIYSYSTDFTLNKAGTWTLRVDANDGSSVNSASTTINVETQNLSTQDGWYGYTENNILKETNIDALSGNYTYTLFEFQINASRMANDIDQLINSTNRSNTQNVRVGINILMNFNYSVASEKTGFYNKLKNFSNFLNDPYQDTLEYISLQLVNASKFSDGDKYGVLNNASQNLTSVTNNQFVIYSKGYSSVNIDNSYIQNTTLKYITASTHSSWILSENNLMRNTSSLNRIYYANSTLKDAIETFQTKIISVVRGIPEPATTVGNLSVAELSNGDFIVFNTQGSNRQFYLNFSNVSGVLTKDIWDYTNKIYIHSNTNGTGRINVSANSATMVFVEDFDHIQGTWVLYKATSSGRKTFNYSTNTNEGNFALDNDADEFKIELFDPHYSINSFITYYGWWNASYITNWSNYRIVIFDDENSDELTPRMVTAPNTDFYCYISVADYANTGAWQSGKHTEVDSCINLNSGSSNVQIFVDGLDTGVGGINFSSQFKDLVDYVKITKNRKVGLNTYTAYQDLCSLSAPSGFCMKESCVMRWNGSSASNPTAYDWENWDLELEKSLWYQSHNVDVLCQSFGNRTVDTFELKNWTEALYVYYASLVLGYDDFSRSQPDFNYAHLQYYPNVGTDLAQSFSTDNNETYYRRYSNGIVYFNNSNKKGWIEDGREIEVQACFNLYDNSDGAGDEERDFEFRVNNVSNTDDNQYTIDSDIITAGVWAWYCTKLNETHESESGNYKIEASTTNGGQVADGIYIGWENKNMTGKHSWYSDTAGSPVWNVYPTDQNWEVKLIVNETKKASVDSFTTQIVQSTTTQGGKTNLSLSAANPFDIEVWSNGITVSRFINLTWYSGTTYHKVYPKNTSTCSSNNPDWNTTSIVGATHKACIETIGSNTFVRVGAPHLSEQTYQINTNTLPIVTIIQPANNTLYNKQPLDINFTVIDTDGDTIQQVNIYINGTLNQTMTTVHNTTLNASDGKYTINISAYDGTDWGDNATILSFKIDTVNPLITGMAINGTLYKSNTSVAVTGSDNNLYGMNCTIYNGLNSSAPILWSVEMINLSATSQIINVNYNTTLGNGVKYTECKASDDHTKTTVPDIEFDIGKTFPLIGKDKSVTFRKGDNLEQDIKIDSPIGAKNVEVYQLEDRYSILYDFSDTKVKGVDNEYNFTLTTISNAIYRVNSKFPAHFVIGKGIGETAVDYVFEGNQDAQYKVKLQKDGSYNVYIKTIENILNFSSILGVNIAVENSTIIIDTTNPSLNQFNLSGKVNASTKTTVNFVTTINISDSNPETAFIYVNDTLNTTTTYQNNISKNISITAGDGYYRVKIGANDSAGNYINFSNILDIEIEVIFPNVTINLTNPVIGAVFTDTNAISINFKFNANDTVHNCTIFLDNSIKGNESSTKTNYNITISSISSGSHEWYAICYDTKNTQVISTTYDFTVNFVSGGTPAPAQQVGGGGGGTPPPSFVGEEIQNLTFNQDDVCDKTREFIQTKRNAQGVFVGYSISDLSIFQAQLTQNVGVNISEPILKSFIDNSESICNINKSLKYTTNLEKTINAIKERLRNITLDIPIEIEWLKSYVPLSKQVDIGKLRLYEDKNALSLLKLLNMVFKLERSDTLIDSPNILITGIRTIPLMTFTIMILIVGISKLGVYLDKRRR